MKKYKRLGLIGRFKPLHNGGGAFLDALLSSSEFVVIGVGSANRDLSYKNPFSALESAAMIEGYLSGRFDNYQIKLINDSGHIPEYADGKKWVSDVRDAFGDLDYFVSGNEYVRELLKDEYHLLHPKNFFFDSGFIDLNATYVRYCIAADFNWKKLVPKKVCDYILDNDLDLRLKEKFGSQILENYSDKCRKFGFEDACAERMKIQ